MLCPFFTSSNPSFGKEDIRNKSSHWDRNTFDLFFFLIIFFDNAIRPNLATQSYLSLGSIMVHFDGYSVEFLSIPSHGNSIRETSPCLSLLSFGYWELRSLRWTSSSLIRLCVCLYWAGGGGGGGQYPQMLYVLTAFCHASLPLLFYCAIPVVIA